MPTVSLRELRIAARRNARLLPKCDECGDLTPSPVLVLDDTANGVPFPVCGGCSEHFAVKA